MRLNKYHDIQLVHHCILCLLDGAYLRHPANHTPVHHQLKSISMVVYCLFVPGIWFGAVFYIWCEA